jgi:hypothetical protein
MSNQISIEVYANNDDATIIIQKPVIIKDCWGFAIYRKRKNETDLEAEPLLTSVGFDGDPHVVDEMRPSTEWPIQKYIWTDYFVKMGDEICYKVIPMIHSDAGLTKNLESASEWSAWTIIGNTANAEGYFNRGLVSSQFVARRLSNVPEKERSKTLAANLADENSAIKQFMGGNLLAALYQLLDDVATNEKLKIYAALYELNELGLIKRLNAIGDRANIILANGAFGQNDSDPQKKNADLLDKIRLTRRIVKTPHFAHNKFLVVTEVQDDQTEKPVKVWTGSTNWTTNGLHTQVNNAVVLKDKEVMDYYKAEWDKILEDCDPSGHGLYGSKYTDYNNTVRSNTAGSIHTYFTPVKNEIDMDEADKYIKAAKKGIMFLMFQPGVENKSRLLYDTIRSMAANPDLLINGVINADPGGKDDPTINFLHNNDEQAGDLNIVLPGSINSPFDYWMAELGKKSVTIHSKVILIDPFSENPVLMTGSHNMGNKASRSNDDNLNIIIGNKDLARAYAIHMASVYHHYRWRFYRAADTGKPKWSGNIKSDAWQQWYANGEKLKEINFWTT